MSFTLGKVVPWGRSFDEYVAMFALTENDLQKKILGCGDGPAAFNAELTKRGGKVVSADPLYRFSAEAIRKRIAETYDEVIEQTIANQDEFVWKNMRSIDELGRVRMAAMESFLVDFPQSDGRYVVAELPLLPFKKLEFELALCSHFLFLYSEQYTAEFHLNAVKELCRVADEVRIFPLLEFGAKKSRHLGRVVAELQASGYSCVIEKVLYEFQKGGDQMLKVKAGN